MNFEEKKTAFDAYRQGMPITDHDLQIALKAIKDLNETLRAFGERGTFLQGYLQLEDALDRIVWMRKLK
jgi:hypothetical protein